jgi:hypothetical protein
MQLLGVSRFNLGLYLCLGLHVCEVRPTEMDALYVCAPIWANFGDGQNAIEGLNGFQV